MNRRDVNNLAVSMAAVLAQTNNDADAEINALQVEVQQLRAALDQHKAAVSAARHAVEQPWFVVDAMVKIPQEQWEKLKDALRKCP